MANRSSVILHARIIGAMFLLAFVFYGVGRSCFDAASPPLSQVGAVLIIINSILVFCIGLLLRKTILQYNVWISNLYLVGRILEAIALASIVLILFYPQYLTDDLGYFWGMLMLGFVSIPMCWVLYKYKLVPGWLAIWGLVGYSILSVGFLLEFFGKHWSMYLLVVGGLWEVTFACWLLFANDKHKGST